MKLNYDLNRINSFADFHIFYALAAMMCLMLLILLCSCVCGRIKRTSVTDRPSQSAIDSVSSSVTIVPDNADNHRDTPPSYNVLQGPEIFPLQLVAPVALPGYGTAVAPPTYDTVVALYGSSPPSYEDSMKNDTYHADISQEEQTS